MNIKNIGRILILILMVFIIFSFSYKVCAIEYAVSKWSNVNQFDNIGAGDDLRKVVQTPLGFILAMVRTVAVIVAVCMLLWAAIRYMAPNFTLFGKALDQAEVKRDIPRFVLGSILLFGTSGLLTFIQYIIEDIFGG